MRIGRALTLGVAVVVLGTGLTACDNNGPKLKPPLNPTTTLIPTTTTTTVPVPAVIEDVVVREDGGCALLGADANATGCRELTVLADGSWTLVEIGTGDDLDDGTLEAETLAAVFGGFATADLSLLSAVSCVDAAPVDGIDISVSISGDGVITDICDDAFGTDPNFLAALEALYTATGWAG